MAPSSMLTLREITEQNRAAVEALAVTHEQSEYVAGVAESLAEAAQYLDAKPWYRAVYADQEPVGFVMISDGIPLGNVDYPRTVLPVATHRRQAVSGPRLRHKGSRPRRRTRPVLGPRRMCFLRPTSSDRHRRVAST